MENNNMLNVQLDLSRGAYIISRNGEEVIVKEINDGTKNNYDKTNMKKRRKEIESMESASKWIPEDLLKLVDPVLYDALEEYDNQNGTKYRSAYVKAITLQVPYTGVSEMKRERQYQRRAASIRTAALERAGISIEYDINLLGKAKGLGLMDKIQALRTAKSQKTVGATIRTSQGNSIVDAIKGIGNSISQSLSGIRAKINERQAKALEAKLLESQRKLEESIPRDENGLIDDVPELSEEEMAILASEALEQTGVKIDIAEPVKPEVKQPVQPPVQEQKPIEQQPPVQEEQKPVEPQPPVVEQPVEIKPPVIDIPVEPQIPAVEPPVETEKKQPEAEVVVPAPEPKPEPEAKKPEAEMPRQPKKKMGRSKQIQASKKAAREAGKMKNSYAERIANKAAAKTIADQRRAEAAVRREEEAKRTEQERIAQERAAFEAKLQQELQEEDARRAAEEADRAIQAKNDKKLSVRFTRKLKNAQDSIRNKVHLPSLTGNQRKIAGFLTAVALMGALGLATGKSDADAGSRRDIPVEPTATISMTMDHVQDELPEIEELVYRDTGDQHAHQTSVKTSDREQKGTVEEKGGTETNVEKSEEDIQKEYLSSVRVGSNMKIDSGKYFASPDGTGNFGHFENFTDGVKEITMIDVITNKGVIVIKDGDVSLYDLKQQYPDAKFSYHFVFRHSDGRTTTLGWLTENSMEQNIEMNQQQMADEGR